MNYSLPLAVGICIGVLVTPVLADATSEVIGSQSSAKLHGELSITLANAADGELIPLTIVMRDRVPREQIDQFRTLRDRKARRQAIKNVLKPLAERTQRELLAMLAAEQRNGRVGERIRTLWIVNVVGVDATADVAYRIAARDDVALLSHNKKYPVFDDPPADNNANADGNIECGVEMLGAPRVWDELGITGQGVVVAMIDSGTCYRHTDLENQIWTNEDEIPDNNIDDDNNGFIDDVIGWNFDSNNNDPDDFFGHGTHTGGTVAGDGTAGFQTGMAPGAKLMLCRVNGQVNEAGEIMVWDSMQYATDNGAHVWNMSLGWAHSWGPVRRVWRDICLNSIAMGLVPVIAAGNEGSCCPPFDHTRTPGDVPEVITVGATNCSGVITGFSSRGPVTWQDIDPYNDWPYPPGKLKPTVSAPGDNTNSTRMCSGYTTMSGTSMATPHVAGAVALMLEANPNLTVEEVKTILIDTALDRGDPGWDNTYGAGLVDAFAAVEMAMSMRVIFVPEELTVIRGRIESGELADLFASDDSRLNVQPGPTQDPEEPPVWLELRSTATTDSPAQLSFILEANVDTPGVTQTIRLFDYVLGEYEEVDSRTASFNQDLAVEIVVDGDPSRFIDPETLEVKAQLTWMPGPIVIVFPWSVGIDQAVWAVMP